MTYRVRHQTRYDYDDPVSISHHILRLTPRNRVPAHPPQLDLHHAEALRPRHTRRLLRQPGDLL